MLLTGIIAEYNPFHKGHEFQINETRKVGATHIVTVLGSYFTQRGDIALLSKSARCEAAISCGSDLVIELPVSRTLSGAESFAFGGVSLLHALGIVDSISFGCECPDKELLKTAARAAESEEIKLSLQKHLAAGLTFASAREKAVKDVFGKEVSDILSSPNNILAAEYISAADRLGANFDFIPIGRTGAAHDSLDEGDIMSATAIRELLKTNPAAAADKLPKISGDILLRELKNGRTASLERLESAILCKLKLMKKEDYEVLPDISEGLENRIYAAAKSAVTLDGLYAAAKSKRYTLARIRRIVLSAFLGITAKDTAAPLPYIRVLGLSDKGREILRAAEGKTKLPIIMRPAEAKSLSADAFKAAELEASAADMFNMAVAFPEEGFSEFKTQIYKTF